MKILIINGPNLNLLGKREPEVYGKNTYQDLVKFLKKNSRVLNVDIRICQSNHEGKIIDYLQYAMKKRYSGVILNAGAYTHYSYAIRDCIAAINIPVVEVHLSNIKMREEFRKTSVISDVCAKTFMGEHFESYRKALEYVTKKN